MWGNGWSVVGVVALVLAVAAPASARRSCEHGQAKTVNGVSVIAFCGTAKVTLHLIGGSYAGPRTVTLTNGSCSTQRRDLVVRIGAVPSRALSSNGLNEPAAPPEHFVLRTRHEAGLQQFGNSVYFGLQQLPWKLTALSTRVTVKKGVRRGTFSGRLLASDADRVTGSFSC